MSRTGGTAWLAPLLDTIMPWLGTMASCGYKKNLRSGVGEHTELSEEVCMTDELLRFSRQSRPVVLKL